MTSPRGDARRSRRASALESLEDRRLPAAAPPGAVLTIPEGAAAGAGASRAHLVGPDRVFIFVQGGLRRSKLRTSDDTKARGQPSDHDPASMAVPSASSGLYIDTRRRRALAMEPDGRLALAQRPLAPLHGPGATRGGSRPLSGG